jgi:hypothetical protein
MANLTPGTAGLPMVVWVSERGRARHDVTVKVALSHGHRASPYNTASVAVRPTPRLVAEQISAADLLAVSEWLPKAMPKRRRNVGIRALCIDCRPLFNRPRRKATANVLQCGARQLSRALWPAGTFLGSARVSGLGLEGRSGRRRLDFNHRLHRVFALALTFAIAARLCRDC